MKNINILSVFFFLICSPIMGQDIIELGTPQSMSISGKGPGQDAAINPFLNTNSIAVVKNIGQNSFMIRLQNKKEIIKTIAIKPDETKRIELLKGYELYFDSELKSKAKVLFEKMLRKSKSK